MILSMIIDQQRICKIICIFCLYTLAALSVGAQSSSPQSKPSATAKIPEGSEPYSVRPDILELKSKAHPGLPKHWDAWKRAHLEAVAMLLELYPSHELYFLARDGELLYDFARVATRNNPAEAQKLNLLNVSRANVRDPNISAYLAQEGINTEALQKGKKILLVDTGFSGTIPEVLRNYFPAAVQDQIKTHLMASANPLHPSSRVFLTALNPAANSIPPSSLLGTIKSYEFLPRFTNRSSRYVLHNDQWEPIASIPNKLKGADGSVSRQSAVEHMEDLRHYAESDEAQKLFQLKRSQWRRLRDLALSADRQTLIGELKNFLAQDPSDNFRQAMARDFIETLSIHGLESPTGRVRLFIQPKDIGLNSVAAIKQGSNRAELISKHPEWSDALKDPETGVKKLIRQGEWGKLAAISDVVHDNDFWNALAKSLGDTKPSTESRTFMNMLLEQANPEILSSLAQSTFSNPKANGMTDVLRQMIEQGNQKVLQKLARYVFSQPHTAGMTDLLRLLIEKGDQNVLYYLAQYVFSQPHTKGMENLLRLLIERADAKTLSALATYTFTQPHSKQFIETLGLMIEKGDPMTHFFLADRAFPFPHMKGMTQPLRLLAERGDKTTRARLLQVLNNSSHFADSEYDVYRHALGIENLQKRNAFLNNELTPKNCERVFEGLLKRKMKRSR